MVHEEIAEDRNITKAAREWDSAIDFSPYANTYKLLNSLLSQADETDNILDRVYHAHQIESAKGKELEQFGKLVNVQRNGGEPDSRYRTRIKAEFAQSRTETTFNDFVEFTASILGTNIANIDISTNYSGNPATVSVFANPQVYESSALSAQEISENIDISTNYSGNPATVSVFANPQVYESSALSAQEISEILGGGVPAGHSVNAQESGTFRLISDGESNDPDKGLTSDSIETGGTLAADLV